MFGVNYFNDKLKLVPDIYITIKLNLTFHVL